MRDQTEIIAYHEAGHTVMAMSCGFTVTDMSIAADSGSPGRVVFQIPAELTPDTRRKAILVFVGGLAADAIHWRKYSESANEVTDGHFDDQTHARGHLSELGEGECFDAYLAMTMRFLADERRWDFVEMVANLLLEANTVNGRDLIFRISEQCPKLGEGDMACLTTIVAMVKRGDLPRLNGSSAQAG